MSYSSRNSYSRYNRYSGRNGHMSNFERTLRRRRKIAAGVITALALILVVAGVWFVASVVNGGGSSIVIGNPTPSAEPTKLVETTPEPTYTQGPTPTPSFTDHLAEEAAKHDRKPIVLIDAGHGYNSEYRLDDGSKGSNTGFYLKDATGELIWEDDINLSIALMLKDMLEGAGCEVIMTRYDENVLKTASTKTPDLIARRDMANASNADVFVSIHQNNYSKDTSINGTQTWCNSAYNEYSDELGAIMLQSVSERIGSVAYNMYDEYQKDFDDCLAIPKATKPTVLIECGFMSNPEELEKLLQKDYQEKIAEGIALGIFEFFNTVTIWK